MAEHILRDISVKQTDDTWEIVSVHEAHQKPHQQGSGERESQVSGVRASSPQASGYTSSDPTEPWKTSGCASSDPTKPWKTSGDSSSDPTEPLKTSGHASSDPTEPWKTSGDASSDPTVPWKTSGCASSDPTKPGKTSGDSSSDPTEPLKTSGHASSDPTEPWKTSGDASSDPTVPWKTSGCASSDPTKPWKTSGDSSSDPTEPLKTSGHASSDPTEPWKTSGDTSSDPTVPWKTSGDASSDPTVPWKSRWQHAAIMAGKVYEMPNPNGQFASPAEVAKWLVSRFPEDSNIPPDAKDLDKCLPIWKPDFDVISQPMSDGIRVTWIGHSTLLVQMDGITILTDPVFSHRCSPGGMPGGPKRYRDAPCSVKDLPRTDVVIISHNHYDHLDKASVKELLCTKFGKNIHWFVPEGLKAWMQKQGCRGENVTESDWWSDNPLPQREGVMFTFTPTQHWSGRGPFDRNMALWGSWCVKTRKHNFFFTGDTGYCDVFKVIGEKYGPFDLAAIPIGAYEPREFMKYQHINPFEAVQIHQELKAKHSVGIHWGTFKLTNEPYMDPPKELQKALGEFQLEEEDFFTLDHGQTCTIRTNADGNRYTLERPEPKYSYRKESRVSTLWSRIIGK